MPVSALSAILNVCALMNGILGLGLLFCRSAWHDERVEPEECLP